MPPFFRPDLLVRSSRGFFVILHYVCIDTYPPADIMPRHIGSMRMARRPKTFAEELRQAIRESGLTHYRIGKDAGIAPDILDRFVNDNRDLRLSTIEKIVAALKLRMTLQEV